MEIVVASSRHREGTDNLAVCPPQMIYKAPLLYLHPLCGEAIVNCGVCSLKLIHNEK